MNQEGSLGYPDSQGMWAATAASPERFTEAVESARRVLDGARLPERSAVASVAVFGLGPDATAALAAAAIAEAYSPVPIWVGQGPEVPAFVGEHTLIVAVSYSGDTVETVRAAQESLARHAHVVVIDGGDAPGLRTGARGEGPLATIAAEAGLPRFRVGVGAPGPRAAVGPATVALLSTLARVGLVPDCEASFSAAAASLAGRRDAWQRDGNLPQAVARRIGRTIPLVYGSGGVTGVAAREWKAAVNLNAKAPAFCATLPGVVHDELAGWGQGGDVTRQVLSLVLLRHDDEDARTAGLFDAVVRATDEVMADVVEVRAEGADDLGRFLDLALFGDLVSLHLAGHEGVDPGPAPAVEDAQAGLV